MATREARREISRVEAWTIARAEHGQGGQREGVDLAEWGCPALWPLCLVRTDVLVETPLGL